MLPLKFILVPMGSAGDVHPLVWIGKVLQERGHDVVVVGQQMIAGMPSGAGLRTVSVGNGPEQEELLKHPDLWHPRRAVRMVAKYMTAYTAEMFPAVQREVTSGPADRTVLVGGALAFAARMAAEKFGTPLFTTHLQPSAIMSVEKPPVMFAGGEWLQSAPMWVRKTLLKFGHWTIDRHIHGPLARLRKSVGIRSPLPKGVMWHWWHSPDAILCMFPEWYAAQANDWPAQTIMGRFPLYDEAAARGVDPELEAWLRKGEEPVVITPGSANVQAGKFLKEAIDGCVRAGKRPAVVTRAPELVEGLLPANGRVFRYVPFSKIFPRAAAVIHHGGIGTTAQCFAAGVPQLIMPMAHDQPDNAARVKGFGVGDYVYPRKFKAGVIAERLERLLHEPEVQGACAKYMGKMRRQMSAEAFGEMVETNAERLLRVRLINGVGVPA